MKVAVITDQHFGVRGDSSLFLDYYEKFYRDVFFPTLDARDIKIVLDLGDTFDRRKYINYLTLRRAKEMYFDELQKRGIQVYSIVGNHTTYFKNTNETNSMDLLLKEYPNYKVYADEPVTITIGGCDIMLSPWLCQSNSEASFKAFKETTAKIVMGHFEFAGFEVMKGQLQDHGLETTDFKKFLAVYSGHYHHPSSHENVTYLGAPYEMTWTDYDGKRGFHLFDTQTLDMEFIQNPYSIFHKIEYDDQDMTLEDIEQLDVSMLTSTYVKVIVKNKLNPYTFDMFINKLESAGCADIKVVEDHMNFDVLNRDELVDEAQDTMSLLRTYVDSMEIKADKEKVTVFLRDLYQEAMSL